MAIEQLRPFIKSKLDALGYYEWTDGFPDDNIPATLTDGAYHQVVGSATAVDNTAKGISISVPVTVRVFQKGYRDPYTKITDAQVAGEAIVKSVCNAANFRYNDIISIYFDSMDVIALDSEQNDNLVVIEIVFDCTLFICF